MEGRNGRFFQKKDTMHPLFMPKLNKATFGDIVAPCLYVLDITLVKQVTNRLES